MNPEKKKAPKSSMLATTRRYFAALSDEDQYTQDYSADIKERMRNVLSDYADTVVLISVYTGKGLGWVLDQFSRQLDSKVQVLVFQNGFARGSETQQRVQQLCNATNVSYVCDPEAHGPWGGKVHGLLNLYDYIHRQPEYVMTFDEDTGPAFSDFVQRNTQRLNEDQSLGAIYSPAIFMYPESVSSTVNLLMYKFITLSGQKIISMRGGHHPVGSNAVFRAEELISGLKSMKSRTPNFEVNNIRENDFAEIISSSGLNLRNTFGLHDVTLTAADKLLHQGIYKYLLISGLINLPSHGIFSKLRDKGFDMYEKLYSDSSYAFNRKDND